MAAPNGRFEVRDNGFALAIEAAGSVPNLAIKLGINRQAIYGWTRIPAERVPQIAKITGLPPRLLRPDLYR
jgi:hypothetical protein